MVSDFLPVGFPLNSKSFSMVAVRGAIAVGGRMHLGVLETCELTDLPSTAFHDGCRHGEKPTVRRSLTVATAAIAIGLSPMRKAGDQKVLSAATRLTPQKGGRPCKPVAN